MNPPVIIDAGPSLNFFAARDERFSAAAGVLRKIRGTQFLAILEDDHTSALDNVVHRLTGAPLEERRSLPKDLGEIMVIAHAVVMAESGADVRVVIDDGYGARLAAPRGCRVGNRAGARRARPSRGEARPNRLAAPRSLTPAALPAPPGSGPDDTRGTRATQCRERRPTQVLLLREEPEAGQEAHRGSGRLHLRRVHRAVQ